MKLSDLNLLEVDIFESEKLIYSGMCNDATDEIQEKNIEIDRIDGKKMILKIK